MTFPWTRNSNSNHTLCHQTYIWLYTSIIFIHKLWSNQWRATVRLAIRHTWPKYLTECAMRMDLGRHPSARLSAAVAGRTPQWPEGLPATFQHHGSYYGRASASTSLPLVLWIPRMPPRNSLALLQSSIWVIRIYTLSLSFTTSLIPLT